MGPSVQQLLIVLAIVIILFGAKKLPELMKGMGKGIKSFKKEMASDDEVQEKVEEKQTLNSEINTQTAEKKDA